MAEWSQQRRQRQSELAKRLHAEGKLRPPKPKPDPNEIVHVIRVDLGDGEPYDLPVRRERWEANESLTDEERGARIAKIVARFRNCDAEQERRALEERKHELDEIAERVRGMKRLDPAKALPGFQGFDGPANELEVQPEDEPVPRSEADVWREQSEPGRVRTAWFDAEGRRIPAPQRDGEQMASGVAAGTSPWQSRGAGVL